MKKKDVRIYKKIGIVVLCLVAAVLIKATWDVYQSYAIAKERKEDEIQKLEKLKARVGDLETEIQYLSTETGINDELVETFPIKREGEQVIILVKQEDVKESSFLLTTKKDKQWWEFWK